MKSSYFYSQPNYLLFRAAIEREQKQFIKSAFAIHLSAVISAERYRSDSEALKSAVLNFVFFIILKNKIEQSAAQSYLSKKLSLSEILTDRTFGNRRSRYKELGKKVPQAYRVYVELILRSDAGDARIFSKEVIHDGLGRISYTAKEGEVYIDGTNDQTQTGWNISSTIHYDKAGRKSEEGMPFFYRGNLEQELVNKNSYEALEAFYELNDFTTIRNGTKYEYDDIDRNILTVLPDGHTQKNEYSIDTSLQITKSVDPLGNISISKKDARGNIREVRRLDKNGSLLTKAKYEYSVLGEMLRAYDAKENIVSVGYDLLGRRISLESLDAG